MKFLFFILLFSFMEHLAQLQFPRSPICESNPKFFCSLGMEPFLQSPPDTDDSLHHLCRLFRLYLKCMRTFADKCDKFEDSKPYRYISDARKFVHDLCFEGSFLHQDYLRFAKCYNSTMPEIRICQEKFDTNHDYYFSPYDVEDPKLINEICKKHLNNVRCISEEINMKCGGEAAHIFLRIVQLSKYLMVTCPNYNDNS